MQELRTATARRCTRYGGEAPIPIAMGEQLVVDSERVFVTRLRQGRDSGSALYVSFDPPEVVLAPVGDPIVVSVAAALRAGGSIRVCA